MAKAIPEGLKAHILPFDWDVRRVWRQPAAIKTAPLSDYASLLDLPLWSSLPGLGLLFDIFPRTAMASPERSPYQAERLDRADIRYPIDVLVWKGLHWILDGVHRIAKHAMLGMPALITGLHRGTTLSAFCIDQRERDA